MLYVICYKRRLAESISRIFTTIKTFLLTFWYVSRRIVHKALSAHAQGITTIASLVGISQLMRNFRQPTVVHPFAAHHIHVMHPSAVMEHLVQLSFRKHQWIAVTRTCLTLRKEVYAAFTKTFSTTAPYSQHKLQTVQYNNTLNQCAVLYNRITVRDDKWINWKTHRVTCNCDWRE